MNNPRSFTKPPSSPDEEPKGRKFGGSGSVSRSILEVGVGNGSFLFGILKRISNDGDISEMLRRFSIVDIEKWEEVLETFNGYEEVLDYDFGDRYKVESFSFDKFVDQPSMVYFLCPFRVKGVGNDNSKILELYLEKMRNKNTVGRIIVGLVTFEADAQHMAKMKEEGKRCDTAFYHGKNFKFKTRFEEMIEENFVLGGVWSLDMKEIEEIKYVHQQSKRSKPTENKPVAFFDFKRSEVKDTRDFRNYWKTQKVYGKEEDYFDVKQYGISGNSTDMIKSLLGMEGAGNENPNVPEDI